MKILKAKKDALKRALVDQKVNRPVS
jgi:hypothetical protein